jgi:hypothetical protein
MLIIDRFEGGFAVVETDNGMINIPKSDMPKGAKEGNVLNIVIDSGETASRKKRIEEKMNRLFKQD